MKGTAFNPTGKQIFWKMLRSEILQWSLNRTPIWNIPRRNRLLRRLLGSIGSNAYLVQNPLHVCYGSNIHIGKNFFANYNCTLMDCASITIGDNVFLGPNVSIVTANHPLLPEQRRIFRTKDSFAPGKLGNWDIIAPVVVGDDVWIGAGAIVLPGVTIGSGSTIAAGSIVTHDVPANVLAAGNPCRVIRPITERDRLTLEK